MRQRKLRITLQGRAIEPERLLQVCQVARRLIPDISAPEVKVVGFAVIRGQFFRWSWCLAQTNGAKDTVRALKAAGIEPVMITGDAEAVARTVAAELGIERYYARVLPGEKVDKVRELQKRARTAFVGDGINDAPALLEADLGVAIGAGTNVAIESADLVLVEDDPADVLAALKLSRATYRKMMLNLAWATGYNAVAIPLAAGVLAGIGVLLSPAVGAVLMSVSTIVVAINAMLLRRTDLTTGV